MKSKQLKYSLLLALAAFIWGVAFVAQSEGGDVVGPYTFNCIRSYIGGIVLLPVIYILEKTGYSTKIPKTGQEKKALWMGGIFCGIALAFASTVQQLGLFYGSSAGKAGFLTACYILIVPILGLFFHKKCGWNIWIGVMLAFIGLYLLCASGDMSLQKSDVFLIACAFLFSIQIMLVDFYAPRVSGVRLACIQFFVSAIVCTIPMVTQEIGFTGESFRMWLTTLTSWQAWITILYAGVLSCGVAYTLQIITQANLNPTVASMIMSLEAVFSVLAGWVILNQHLSKRELIGCAVMFGAIIIAQIPIRSQLNKEA